MSTPSSQRDLGFKTETYLNLKTLNQFHPMPQELATALFKENALKKPTQQVFYNLSHYLMLVIDPNLSASLPWPLYDSKTERIYRNEFSKVVADYSNKGLVSPVMSSYLVNPGCFKVTVLLYQLSLLGVKRSVLVASMKKEHHKRLYEEVTERYNLQHEDFIANIKNHTEEMMSKCSNHLRKRQMFENITQKFRSRITEMEEKLAACKAQNIIDNLVSGYLNKYNVNESVKEDILKIKNVEEPSLVFETCLEETDRRINELENQWEQASASILNVARNTCNATQDLIARYTGEMDKKSYVIEYNHKTDGFETKDLQSEVNSQQKYILKNMVQDEQLNYPNLVRGFLISACYILKDIEIGDDVYKFNQCLAEGRRNIREITSGMGMLVERLRNLESKLQVGPVIFPESTSTIALIKIPPLPDFSDLKFHRDNNILFDGFTPFSISKRKFNLRRKVSNNSFTKPRPKPLITPFYHEQKDDYLKNLISCRFNAYDNCNMSKNVNNLSMISHISHQRTNETISESSMGFTQQQMLRLLSTRKKSSTKKYDYKTDRPHNLKTGALFNESTSSNESNALFRSHSSPNLYEHREKRSRTKMIGRNLTIMQEDSPQSLNLSGITAINNDSGTPQSIANLEMDRKVSSDVNLRKSPEQYANIFKQVDLNKLKARATSKIPTINVEMPSTNIAIAEKDPQKIVTPKNNPPMIKKTSSLEKIINRFKKVRASALQMDRKEDESSDFQTIVEERDNFNTVDPFSANRLLLPDLLSPSFSNTLKSTDLSEADIDIEDDIRRKPRESLGTVLGVDHTFLDQFDLID